MLAPPAAQEQPEVVEARAATVSDIYATAFARYASGFVTFGLTALGLATLPAIAVAMARAAGAGTEPSTVLAIVVATVAYLLLVGSVTALIGGRLRKVAGSLVLVAVLAAPPLAALIVLTQVASVLLLPFLLPMVALAPVAVGAGEATGVTACRQAVSLVLKRGYGRSLGVSAGLVALGAILFLGVGAALSPLPGLARALAVLAVFAATYGPLSALVMRSLYGSLTGQLVVGGR